MFHVTFKFRAARSDILPDPHPKRVRAADLGHVLHEHIVEPAQEAQPLGLAKDARKVDAVAEVGLGGSDEAGHAAVRRPRALALKEALAPRHVEPVTLDTGSAAPGVGEGRGGAHVAHPEPVVATLSHMFSKVSSKPSKSPVAG